MIAEIIISLFIFSIALISSAALLFNSSDTIQKSNLHHEMIIEAVQTLRESLLLENHTTLYSTPCFKRHISENKKLDAYQLDREYTTAIDSDCGGFMPKDSSLPIIQTHTLLSSTIETQTLDAFNSQLFIGATSEIPEDADLFITNTEKNIVSSLNTGLGIAAIDATKSFVYAAAVGTKEQLVIIDIKDPLHPRSISTSTLPTVTGSFPSGRSIFYYYPYVYIGVHRTAGHEFHIYDVSNPYSPVWKSSIELNHNINKISVRPPYAFLASSGNTDDIIVLDISNPLQIKKKTGISFLGNEDTLTLFLAGNRLYVGRAKSTAPSNPDFLILDIADIENIHILHSYRLSTAVMDIYATGDFAFAVTNAGVKNSLYSFTLSASPLQANKISDLVSKPFDIDYEKNILYVAN